MSRPRNTELAPTSATVTEALEAIGALPYRYRDRFRYRKTRDSNREFDSDTDIDRTSGSIWVI